MSDLRIGDFMDYTDSRGRTCRGQILNWHSCRLMDVNTGSVYPGRRFYLWDDENERCFWTAGMRPIAQESAQ